MSNGYHAGRGGAQAEQFIPELERRKVRGLSGTPPFAYHFCMQRKLPGLKSDPAERKFWSRHSVEEFRDELEDLEVQIRPARTEQIALRLYKDDLETLKKLAKRRGVGHTTLARSIVERWLAIPKH
jgi:predicted DNA binding CopG/RHH family protein